MTPAQVLAEFDAYGPAVSYSWWRGCGAVVQTMMDREGQRHEVAEIAGEACGWGEAESDGART